MKLLIITQVLDTEHPILGFFHRWVAEFSTQVDSIEVIALQVGKYDLLTNVHVHSLGKESGENRLKYLWRFYKNIWQLRHSYDGVFVHMNQQYVLLGYPVWKLFGKRIGLWYAHGAVSTSLALAVSLADTVFTSTPEGLAIDTPKRVIMGQGIDYQYFAPSPSVRSTRELLELVTVGRISASKNIGILLAACVLLKEAQISFHFSIIGGPLTPEDNQYQATLQRCCVDNNLVDQVTWVGGVTQRDLPSYLHQGDIFIHDGSTKSLDKVLLEAVAAGCVVVSSNEAYRAFTESWAPVNLFIPKDSRALARRIEELAGESDQARIATMQQIQLAVQSDHSIQGLISGIVQRYV